MQGYRSWAQVALILEVKHGVAMDYTRKTDSQSTSLAMASTMVPMTHATMQGSIRSSGSAHGFFR